MSVNPTYPAHELPVNAQRSFGGDGVEIVTHGVHCPRRDATVTLGACLACDSFDGLVAGETGRGAEAFARTFAHEVGHYLGLEHNHGSTCPSTDSGRRNLMAQTRCVPMISGTTTRDVRNAVRLTPSQGGTMRDHCASTVGC